MPSTIRSVFPEVATPRTQGEAFDHGHNLGGHTRLQEEHANMATPTASLQENGGGAASFLEA